MTRDYKHKNIAPKKVYQRRSQQQMDESAEAKIGLRWFWPVIVLMSLALIGGFFVVEHFAEQGVKSEVSSPKNVAKNASDAEIKVYKAQGIKGASNPLDVKDNAEQNDSTHESTDSSGQTESAETSKIHYTFYKGLAETEVVVDAEPISVKLEYPYYIQAGTFNTEERALKEQKRLANEGLHLTISTIEYHGKTYYRLRMGPYEDRLVMNRQRNELRRFGVDTLLIRQKNPTPDSDKEK